MKYPFTDLGRVKYLPVWKIFLIMVAIWFAAQAAAIFSLVIVAFSNQLLFWISDTHIDIGVFSALTIIVTVFLSSLAMIFLVLLWSVGAERKNLADLGVRSDATGWRQYGIGLVGGLLFVLSLVLLVIGAQEIFSFGTTSEKLINLLSGWDNLGGSKFWMMVVVLAVLFAVQGASEELFCRGWLLGALAAKRGIVFGLIMSSFLFASLHIHYFFNDGLAISSKQLLIGSIAIGAMFFMGIMFGLFSIRDRSIMGAAGFHSSFNFFAVVFSMIAILQSEEAKEVMEALSQAFSKSTSVQDLTPALVVQLVLSVLVSGFLFWRFGLPKSETSSEKL